MSKCFALLSFLIVILACNRNELTDQDIQTPFLQAESDWADSMLLEMTLDEKIGQLFFLRNNLSSEGSVDSLFSLGTNGAIGGLLLSGTTLDQYVKVVDSLQQMVRFPLLTGTAQMISLKNQFKDLKHFPLPATISAIQKDSLQELLHSLYLQQCKTLGIHFTFAPQLNQLEVTDSGFNFQAMESNPQALYKKSRHYLQRIQEEGILAIGNSFEDLIYVENDTVGFVDSLLYKYDQLVQRGLSGMLISDKIFQHPDVEKLEVGFVSTYLGDRLSFDGLIFSQITADAPIGELIHAGADVFIVDSNVVEHQLFIKQLIEQDLFSEKEVNEKVYKVLMAKAWMNFNEERSKIDTEKIAKYFRNDNFDFYIKTLHESAIILAHNYHQLLPFKKTYKRPFRIVHVGNKSMQTFQQYFAKYADYNQKLHKPLESGTIKPLSIKRYKKSKLVITLDQLDLSPFKDRPFINSINELGQNADVVVVNFGNPKNLSHLDTTITVVQIFERNSTTEALVPQILFGGAQAKGKLPLAINSHLKYRSQNITPITRLKYVSPEEVGVAPYKLVGIEALMRSGIANGSTPGGQIMLIKNGKVFYQEAFGYHTYDKKQPVKNKDLYDLASLTKISATTIAAMKLYENEQLDLSKKIKDYLAVGEDSRLKNITLKQLFKHQSGLQSNMPVAEYILYKDTLNLDCNKYFCKSPEENYTLQIADSMYMNAKWVDTLWKEVYDLKPRRRKRFRYSDVNFNLVQKIIEAKTKKPLDDYVQETFYKPLNLTSCLYNPLEKYDSLQIVPTAYDHRWRKQVLRGYVHDESAALMGGVGGNAGLFSNTNDLATLFQMLLNGGSYGGATYLQPETIKYFTTARHGNHRGLGFDMNAKRSAPSCSSKASKKTYGHTGFTGTCIWVDPEEELIFIFLANRIYPDVKNRRIFKNRLRTRVHNLVYQSLDSYKPLTLKKQKKLSVSKAEFVAVKKGEDLSCID